MSHLLLWKYARIAFIGRLVIRALALSPSFSRQVYKQLKDFHPNLTVYRQSDLPDRWRYKQGRYVAPLTGVADLGWFILGVRHLCVCVYMCVCVCVCVCVLLLISICLLSVCLSVSLSLLLSICLSVCLSLIYHEIERTTHGHRR